MIDESDQSVERFLKSTSDRRLELMRGKIIELPPPDQVDSQVTSNICAALNRWSKESRASFITLPDNRVLTDSKRKTIRCPSISLIRSEQMPGGQWPVGRVDSTPTLVVQVKSKSDRWTWLLKVVAECLCRGVAEVWIPVPASRKVYVFNAEEGPSQCSEDDLIRSEHVLPGFECEVRMFFAELDFQ